MSKIKNRNKKSNNKKKKKKKMSTKIKKILSNKNKKKPRDRKNKNKMNKKPEVIRILIEEKTIKIILRIKDTVVQSHFGSILIQI